MKQTVNLHDFREAFQAIRPDNFSYEGLEHLYNWLVDYEESCDTEIDFDVIAICCDFVEEKINDIIENYGIENFGVTDYLEDNTIIVGKTDTTIIYMAF